MFLECLAENDLPKYLSKFFTSFSKKNNLFSFLLILIKFNIKFFTM